jgi:hypothetical protein
LYRDQDISLILLTKIEHVVRIIAEREREGFDAIYPIFLNSKTHKALCNPDTLLWAESAEFIVDEYNREIASSRHRK